MRAENCSQVSQLTACAERVFRTTLCVYYHMLFPALHLQDTYIRTSLTPFTIRHHPAPLSGSMSSTQSRDDSTWPIYPPHLPAHQHLQTPLERTTTLLRKSLIVPSQSRTTRKTCLRYLALHARLYLLVLSTSRWWSVISLLQARTSSHRCSTLTVRLFWSIAWLSCRPTTAHFCSSTRPKPVRRHLCATILDLFWTRF